MNKNVRVAVVVFVVTLLWFASGIWKAPKVEEKAESTENRRTLVTAARFTAQPYASQFQARGRTEPNRQVSLRAEVAGRVVAVPAERGQSVAEGDVICELAVEDRQQRLDEAKAALREAQLRFEGVNKLKQQGLQSELAIAEANSARQRAQADLQRRQLDLRNTAIRAPFDGVVEVRDVEQGDFMNRGDVCGHILEVSPLKVIAQVSEQQVQQINLGSPAEVRFVDGSSAQGKVSYLSQQASAATRTYRIEATIDNPEGRLRAGLTAQFVVSSQPLMAQRIPSGILGLGDQGEVGVRLLNGDNRVAFQEVQIVGDDSQGVWVLGLPDQALLITVGQEYVANGEQVDVKIAGESDVDADTVGALVP
ncbi:efflux RND transporter periplasmic adaptor subunit [bacterium SCSIO 12696]|nr:efflux RND transporter periplasmic adaptor subunit [bacterium SCSIO 12696]